jgi:hypothetical protein
LTGDRAFANRHEWTWEWGEFHYRGSWVLGDERVWIYISVSDEPLGALEVIPGLTRDQVRRIVSRYVERFGRP